MTTSRRWPNDRTVAYTVLQELMAYGALCRREFAQRDIYEVSARIGELRRLGWNIESRPCKRHNHNRIRGLVEYVFGSQA